MIAKIFLTGILAGWASAILIMLLRGKAPARPMLETWQPPPLPPATRRQLADARRVARADLTAVQRSAPPARTEFGGGT